MWYSHLHVFDSDITETFDATILYFSIISPDPV